MNHDTVVEDWRENAERNDTENYQFLRSMKAKDYGFDPDELAGELHKQAFEIVDCTRCATFEVRLTTGYRHETVSRALNLPGMATMKWTRRWDEVGWSLTAKK